MGEWRRREQKGVITKTLRLVVVLTFSEYHAENEIGRAAENSKLKMN
jgi:hypothetical protein